MDRRRVLVLGLDGFDIDLAERFVQEGLLPNFARLQTQGSLFDLDQGRDKYSGLGWEHFSSGIRATDGGRWSSVTFDRHTYQAVQDLTRVRPFLADLAVKTAVFDPPYVDLSVATNVRGITSWGAHDPGIVPASRPDGLHQEIADRFGSYPASEWIYGFCWPSAQKTQSAGEALTRAVEVRSRASRWLLEERLPDWDLSIVAVEECHSSIEMMWYGVGENHPLHKLESAPYAAAALRNIYAAVDGLIGNLHEAFPDAILVLFAMHGMGPNDADVPAMSLLPELLYRFCFGSPHTQPVEFPGALPDGTPLLAEHDTWGGALAQAVPYFKPRFDQRVARRIKRMAAARRGVKAGFDLDWMPAARYSHFWRKMRAFALPSYYDGRVRLNVAGREAHGTVSPAEYAKVCTQIRDLIGECRNALDGEPVASEIYCPKQNPREVGPNEADIYIVWKGSPLGFSHPRLGRIGPFPYNRTGGHTGKRGFLNIVGDGVPIGVHPVVSSYDVVPTIIELLGQPGLPSISGRSLVPELAPALHR